MTEVSEAELIKRSFHIVDKQGTGFFSRADLSKVFKELDDWSQEDLDELFDAVDTKKDGNINYVALIDWIMQGDEGAAEVPEGPVESDDDDDEADQVAMLAHCKELSLDLHTKVKLTEWLQIAAILDIERHEAEELYKEVEHELIQRGRHTQRGIELHEFLDDLDIFPSDRESLAELDAAVDAVRSGRASAHHAVAGDSAVKIAAATIAYGLKRAEKPAEEAWAMLTDGACLTRVGKDAVVKTYGNNKDALVQLVRQYMKSPPLIPATAGQRANQEHCAASVDEFIRQCRAAGKKFSDPDWDFATNANAILYVDKTGPGYDCTVAKPNGYQRLSDMVSSPVLFKSGIGAGDIKQGQIGTCFLLGALGAIAANKEEAITKSFIKYDIGLGIYGVRFCVDGEWSYVIIDDVMPVDAKGRLLYARSADPQELWVPLLEKAFCKLNTCYEMCDGGKPGQAIYHFCGGASGTLAISDKHRADPASYFGILRNCRSRGWLLTTTFVVNNSAARGAGKCGEAVLPTGLVGGHVYSVLQLIEADGVRLVQCRNPWGTGEWKGKYSDANQSGEWTASLVAATGWTTENDGKFWMNIEDFVANSAGVEYARTFGPQWKKMSTSSRFPSTKLQATAQWAYKARKQDELEVAKGETIEVSTMNPGWWYGTVLGAPDRKGFFPGNYVKIIERAVARFDLVCESDTNPDSPEMSAVIILNQQDARAQRKWYTRPDGKTYKDLTYPDMQLVMLDSAGKVAFKSNGKKRNISAEIPMPNGGTWRLYALCLDAPGSEFMLKVYIKGGTASLTEVENAKISEVIPAISG